MEAEGSLHCSQQNADGRHYEPNKLVTVTRSTYVRFTLILSFHSCLELSYYCYGYVFSLYVYV